jgi:ribosomal protein S18 acetylase RimI-like enzyme
MEIRKVGLSDVEALLPLFNAYRDFYKQEPQPERARAFLRENLMRNRSTIFIAVNESGKAVGFTQLYPTVSSLSMAPVVYLSDLFVDDQYRKNGIAKLLMKAAEKFALEFGAVAIDLQTAHTNTKAQKLYESLGYEQDQAYRTYTLKLPVLQALSA